MTHEILLAMQSYFFRGIVFTICLSQLSILVWHEIYFTLHVSLFSYPWKSKSTSRIVTLFSRQPQSHVIFNCIVNVFTYLMHSFLKLLELISFSWESYPILIFKRVQFVSCPFIYSFDRDFRAIARLGALFTGDDSTLPSSLCS